MWQAEVVPWVSYGTRGDTVYRGKGHPFEGRSMPWWERRWRVDYSVQCGRRHVRFLVGIRGNFGSSKLSVQDADLGLNFPTPPILEERHTRIYDTAFHIISHGSRIHILQPNFKRNIKTKVNTYPALKKGNESSKCENGAILFHLVFFHTGTFIG